VQGFNGQLERIAELVVVIIAGAMLSYTYIPPKAVWFVLLLFLVARPAAVWLGLVGATSVSRDQRILISWFGIRGVGSIFYLMYAINRACRQLADSSSRSPSTVPHPSCSRHLGDARS
jgi:NhaP-type Na+/H+ or K+/H+ antiporter